MNRRAFLASLLATTAAIPLARAAPLRLRTLVPENSWRHIVRAANIEYTAFYMTDEAPIRVTGFIPFWSPDK